MNFDFADFNGGFGGQQMDISTLMGGTPTTGAGMGAATSMALQGDGGKIILPTAEELEDVNFTPPFYARYGVNHQQSNFQPQSQW